MLAGIVINEFHFDPDINTEKVEFIELYNSGAAAVDLSGWRIDEAVDYSFAAGATIPAGGYLVVTQDAADFQTKFGFPPFGQWKVGDKLSNDGETIELRDAANGLVDTVSYKLGFPWPTKGDFGSSIELINPELDNDLAGNWRSSGFSSQSAVNTQLVAADSLWSYRKGVTQNPPANWQLTSFNPLTDPVAWQSGGAPIGYGASGLSTTLGDMRNNYSSIYLRKDFTIAGDVPDVLKLRVYVDDGAIITINGVEVAREHVTAGIKNYNSTSGATHDAAWEEITLTGASNYLLVGTNTIAVHVLNTSLSSSDLTFNLELRIPGDSPGPPTPGAQNSVYASNAAPQMRQLTQSVEQPTSGQAVTISMKITDPDGVQSVTLEYQLVDPGSYIRLTDEAYQTNWTALAMHDDGLNGDAVAGDSVYSVIMNGSLQTNRRLVRYRVVATDALGASVRGPYADDPQPNFAYFVYDGVPDYTASLRPGVLPNQVYSGDVLDDVATYQLLANSQDVQNSQYNPDYYEVPFWGTFVYDGIVYDHVEFRDRGVYSTYQVGKNKWKIEFQTGHPLLARDNYGNLYAEPWDEINILPGTNPWWRNDVSTDGTVLFEPVAFKLYELAGTPSSNTQFFNFRVIDGASATGADQYSGDYWGLYIGIEQPDGSFLDERGLDDGSIFNLHGGAFGETTQRHQGSDLPEDRSDLEAFLDGIDGGVETLEWWEQNLNWDSYFAWNIINHAVNNADIRPNENVNYYHDQVTGQWYVIPWDLDLTFEDAPHQGQPVTTRENIRSLMRDHPLAKLAYENRLREIVDLMLANGDAANVVKEYANFLTLDGTDQTIVQANQAQWDYNPLKVKKGIWYENFTPALLPSKSFDGLVSYMQTYLSRGGYGYDLLAGQGNDADIPDTPSISYVGAPGFAIDGLAFQTTAYSDPQGAATFAKLEWRVAEVYNPSVANYSPGHPYVYETEGTWESGELSSFGSQVTVPAGAIQAGKTYRARVRMQDADGHWSHWSEPVEFLAAEAESKLTLALSEFNYHPADTDDLEFIEILNYGSEPVSLAGVRLTEFISPEVYTFDSSLNLAPGQRIVVARDPVVFQAAYGTAINLAPTGFKFDDKNLSNSGERILLLGPADEILADVNYTDDPPWPTEADGDGPSLEIIDPRGDANDPLNWRASLANGGSPGTDGVSHAALPGDYDGNGAIELADYSVWKSTFAINVAPFTSADGNGDGRIDAADYSVWRDHLGATLEISAGAASITTQAARDEEIRNKDSIFTDAANQELALPPAGGVTTIDDLRPFRPLSPVHLSDDLLLEVSHRRIISTSMPPLATDLEDLRMDQIDEPCFEQIDSVFAESAGHLAHVFGAIPYNTLRLHQPRE
jgi:CotH kinase protein/Lamin Tail Domain